MTICDGCHEEVTRARWIEEKGWFCKRCDIGPAYDRSVSGSMFPFVTTNLSPKMQPVEVQSLRHLRKLEAQYGAQSVAFNTNSSSWDLPPRTNLPGYAGYSRRD